MLGPSPTQWRELRPPSRPAEVTPRPAVKQKGVCHLHMQAARYSYTDTPYMQLIRRNTDICTPVCTFSFTVIRLQPPANKPLAGPVSLKWKYCRVAAGNKQRCEQYFPMYDSHWSQQTKGASRAWQEWWGHPCV
jgi:hypothetical protein